MKFNFRKISAVLASVVMFGSTIGMAAAANYPAPFVSAGAANVAVVYGTGEGVSALDLVQAGNIQSNLQSKMGATSASGGSVSGGDSFKFDKTSTKFWLGRGTKDIVSTAITDDDLPTLLADGVFTDDDNDEFDYSQKITMSNLTLTMWEDNDYKKDEPSVGIKIASGVHVLNYTLEFTDQPDWDDLVTADLPIMGKNYYVLSKNSSTTAELTLLDSAVTTTLAEGEVTTINVDGTPYEAAINFIGSSTVKLDINGDVTNTLSAAQTAKLKDGAYIGVREINTQDYAGGIKTVEFSIGKGKLKLTNNTDIQINDETVSGLSTWITISTGDIKELKLVWDADDDLFVTPDSEVLMPGFGVVKVAFTGLLYPVEETITVKAGGDKYATLENFPLKDSTEDIDFLFASTAGKFIQPGKDSDDLLRTSNSTTTAKGMIFDKDLDYAWIVTYDDGSDCESYVMRATGFQLDGSYNETNIEYKKDGAWVAVKSEVRPDDTVSLGNVELKIDEVNKTEKSVLINMTSSNTNFNYICSKEGMRFYLPWNCNETLGTEVRGCDNNTADGVTTNTGVAHGLLITNGSQNITGHNSTKFFLYAVEEDKDGNTGKGDTINMTIGWDSDNEVEVIAMDQNDTVQVLTEIQETDVWRTFTYSALATEVLYDKPTSGQKSVKLIYHGGEVYGEVYLMQPGASAAAGTSGTSRTVASLGEILVKDSEVSSVSTKNLIIIGGSCINSAAATALGIAGKTCSAAFTEATGVGSGQFLIKGVSGAYSAGKIALVVAGYDAADTVNAAKYLTTQTVDTSKKYIGTSSTAATLQVETAATA